jgi:hypothetical protein
MEKACRNMVSRQSAFPSRYFAGAMKQQQKCRFSLRRATFDGVRFGECFFGGFLGPRKLFSVKVTSDFC